MATKKIASALKEKSRGSKQLISVLLNGQEAIRVYHFKKRNFNNNEVPMWIDSIVGNRRYGGYTSSIYSIDVSTYESSLKKNSIKVNFRFNDDSNQQGGSVQLNQSEAYWLAMTILDAVSSLQG